MYLVEYNLEFDNSIDPCKRFCLLGTYLRDNIHLSIFSVNKKNNIVTIRSIIYSQKNPFRCGSRLLQVILFEIDCEIIYTNLLDFFWSVHKLNKLGKFW